MYHLYTAPTGNGRRPVVMLEECGIPYELHKVDLAKGEQKKPEFLALNPQGAIPVLVDEEGGKKTVLTQSAAILLHLAEKTGKFLPKSGADRATALQWFMMVHTDAAPASSAIFYSSQIPDKSDANTKFYENRFLDLLEVINERLGKSTYLAGADLSIADIGLIPVVAARQELIGGAKRLDNLERWAKSMMARPAVAKALKAAA